MIKNYLKIAVRNLLKNKGFSFISIAGLTIGITSCFLLLLFVRDEAGFDSFYEKGDRIARIVEVETTPEGGERHYGVTSISMGDIMESEFPEVTGSVAMMQFGQGVFQSGENKISVRDWVLTSPEVFDVFDYTLSKGDISSSLTGPGSVVLTKESAVKFFGNEEPIGKVIESDRFGDLKVTGVLDEIPGNTHLQFSMLISYLTLSAEFRERISPPDVLASSVYLLFDEPGSIDKFSEKLPAFVSRYPDRETGERKMYLQKLEDVRFNSAEVEFGLDEEKGKSEYVYLFGAVGIFILLIASVNYINLVTARSLQRAREVGIRKVLGADRRQLVFQFLFEAGLSSLISFLLAIVMIDLLMPYFNDISGKNFDFSLENTGLYLLFAFVITVLLAVISGSLPALVLSGFKPSSAVKGTTKAGGSGVNLRRTLVVTQFALSLIMIISTMVVYSQLDYINGRELGFNKEGLVVVDINSRNVRDNFESIKQEFLRSPGITHVSATSRVPGEWKEIPEINAVPTGVKNTTPILTSLFCFDEDAPGTFGFGIIEGSNFSGNPEQDSGKALLNESAVKQMGLDSPIGQRVRLTEGGEEFEAEVIGVVKDFNFKSLHEKVGPAVILSWKNPLESIDYITARVSGGGIPAAVNFIKQVYDNFEKESPLEYHFLDEQMKIFYEGEERTGKIFGIGAVLTVFIACLGLFGLASYTVERRKKEIGVRKVLGASVSNVVVLISKEFMILVGISAAIACPLSYLLMSKWLEDFAYRTEIGIGIFAISSLAVLLISMATVSYQAAKAGLMNPVDSIRYE